MVYKEKVQGLLDSLSNKFKIIEQISRGEVNLPARDVKSIINETSSLIERISNLVNAER